MKLSEKIQTAIDTLVDASGIDRKKTTSDQAAAMSRLHHLIHELCEMETDVRTAWVAMERARERQDRT